MYFLCTVGIKEFHCFAHLSASYDTVVNKEQLGGIRFDYAITCNGACVVDKNGTVVAEHPLTNEEMLILIEKLADIHAGLYEYQQIVTQQDMVDFIEVEFGRIGADSHITPREVIRDFIEVLDIVYQNPQVKVRELLGSDQFHYAQNAVLEETSGGSFAEFEI